MISSLFQLNSPGGFVFHISAMGHQIVLNDHLKFVFTFLAFSHPDFLFTSSKMVPRVHVCQLSPASHTNKNTQIFAKDGRD